MSFLTDKINKSKVQNNETDIITPTVTAAIKKITYADVINAPYVIPKPKPFKLGIGVASTKPISTDEEPKNPVHNIEQSNSPFAGLKDAVSSIKANESLSIKNILGNTTAKTPQTSEINNAEAPQNEVPLQQNRSNPPTLEDLSKFVFEEQPDESTEEIAMRFSGMLDNLGLAVGTDIPKVLSETLLFMKTNPFLATLLKPEEIGNLVKTMARSYGFVANNQVQKSGKKKAKAKEQNAILNSLDSLSF